jgi:uncharacterized membrane protein
MSILADWSFHIHLIAAISWIGGSIFMFVLGITLRDKEAQKKVYPHVGPIFGWFEAVVFVILLVTGGILGIEYGLFDLLMHPNDSAVSSALQKKVALVVTLAVPTVIHFIIAYRTNDKERTPLEQLLSRGSSMAIFFLNLFVMHYAIMLRDIL